MSQLIRFAPIEQYLQSVGLQVFTNIPVLSGINMASLPYLIYIGVGVTGLGFATYFLAMEATSATEASVVFFIKPMVAPLMAWFVLKEPITFNMIVGIVFIVIGSAISFIPKIKKARAK